MIIGSAEKRKFVFSIDMDYMRKERLLGLFLMVSTVAVAQQKVKEDSLSLKELDEVVVTATRNERKLGNVAVPTRIISQKQIQQAGSLRLKDILQEQPGLFITSGFGAGVQMQGLSSDYTLILIDGEPLVGRTAGVLDLNRIAVGQIKKIEIVKGPSSSLYGSEAMAGVINIITDRSYKSKFSANLRHGFGNPDKGWAAPFGENTFRQEDIGIQASKRLGKLGLNFSSNAYYVDALSYRPFTVERFKQPIWRLNQQLNATYDFSARTQLNLGVRYAFDEIQKRIVVQNNGQNTTSFGTETINDININPTLTHQFNDKVKSSLRLYHTRFNGAERLRFDDKDSSYNDTFIQRFTRVENQTDFALNKVDITVGAGAIADEAKSTRYDNLSDVKRNRILYGFGQAEYRINKFTLIGGVRYDDNQLFAAAFSPKFAVQYAPNQKIRLNASIGRGFKAPDFRQLYLNFTNTAAGGYSVLGSIDAVKIIEQQQSLGLINEIKPEYYLLANLKPEFSTGINIGGSYYPSPNSSIKLNLFRNDIENLIESRLVALRNDGSQIFSYINVSRAFTQGIELEAACNFGKHWQISGGYQYLQTADKDQLKAIDAGKEFTRNPDGTVVVVTRKDYVGLPNRSNHMLNLKLGYEVAQKWYANARLNYRSRWVVGNSDGNNVYNTNDEFAKGFPLINIAGGYHLTPVTRLQAGMDNVTNYQDQSYLPNLQGRMIWVGVHFDFLSNHKNQKTK